MPPPQLAPDDRVALLTPGDASYAELVLALLAQGVFPVPLDPGLMPSERERVLGPIRPDLVVTSPAEVEQLLAAQPTWSRRALPRGRPIHCTSGTTGTPKGVFSGERTVEEAQALVSEERDLWGFDESDVNLVVSPLHHSAPLRFATGTLLAGGRLVVPGRFDPARVTAAIEHQRPTTMFCVPTHLRRLLDHWDRTTVPDLTCFRLVAHAGAPCPAPLKRRVIDLFGEDVVWEFYGSTEGQFTACGASEWLARPGTVGRARPGRTMLADPDGRLWCVVPEHARFSYLGAPEQTAAAWRTTPTGPAFTVGDVGRIDDQGYVFLDGRRTDLIISGGVNVYPLEVENALRDHPGVDDVAVHAVEDPDWGQRVVATVVGDADVAALHAWARERLSAAKRPKDYRFVADLPLTSTGKVRRDQL